MLGGGESNPPYPVVEGRSLEILCDLLARGEDGLDSFRVTLIERSVGAIVNYVFCSAMRWTFVARFPYSF